MRIVLIVMVLVLLENVLVVRVNKYYSPVGLFVELLQGYVMYLSFVLELDLIVQLIPYSLP
jgi:hypothetical protein